MADIYGLGPGCCCGPTPPTYPASTCSGCKLYLTTLHVAVSIPTDRCVWEAPNSPLCGQGTIPFPAFPTREFDLQPSGAYGFQWSSGYVPIGQVTYTVDGGPAYDVVTVVALVTFSCTHGVVETRPIGGGALRVQPYIIRDDYHDGSGSVQTFNYPPGSQPLFGFGATIQATCPPYVGVGRLYADTGGGYNTPGAGDTGFDATVTQPRVAT